MRLFIDSGAVLDKVSCRSGETALHVACRRDHVRIVRLLVNKGANVNAVNKSGETPLHTAVFAGSMLSARLLLKHGADVNARDSCQRTPMHVLCMRSSLWHTLTIGPLLLHNGASAEGPECLDVDGKTPMDYATVCNPILVYHLL